MAIVVQIVLEFESWNIAESICVLHQVQGPFDFLFSWSCGSRNNKVETEFLGTQENIIFLILCDFFLIF
jgi:hypothetical protein